MTRLTKQRRSHYWFSSADESAAFEFADYCRFWLKTVGTVVEIVVEDVRDDLTGRDAKAFVITVNGFRITAMSSNPRRFRSKGGDVCLDEFAFHDDPRKMWAAAYPSITWGDSIRVLSTHNGEGSEFHKKIKSGQPFAEGVTLRDHARGFGLIVGMHVLRSERFADALKSEFPDVSKDFTTTDGDALIPEDYNATIVDLIEEYGVFERNALTYPMTRDTMR
ncbi:MAG: hypothetical protein AAF663_00760 [Planctomycetota bacterium]